MANNNQALSYGSVERCNHIFGGGLCTLCLCPELPKYQRRAEMALDNAEALQRKACYPFNRRLSREDAIVAAWRSHREQSK